MQAILDILISLGVNKTVFPQAAIFLVAFIFLKFFIFSPYLKAYEERRKRTVGSAGVAKELQDEIARLESEYAVEAKSINEKIKQIFDAKNSQAQKETLGILADAQNATQAKLNEGRKAAQSAYTQAKDQLKTFVPEIGQTIKQRLLDR